MGRTKERDSMETTQVLGSWTPDAFTVGAGLLVARLALGLTLAAHGAQKLFGWFGGHGIPGTCRFFLPLPSPARAPLRPPPALPHFSPLPPPPPLLPSPPLPPPSTA